MKCSIIILVLIFTGCTSNIKIVDPDGMPISGAVVISTYRVMFGGSETIIDTSNNDGDVYTAISPFNYIYKNGYHPIIEGTDLAEVLYPRETEKDQVSFHSFLDSPYYPVNILPSTVSETATLFPIVSPGKIPYAIKVIEFTINNMGENIIEFEGCNNVVIKYFHKDDSYVVISQGKNLLKSERFFFVKANSGNMQNQIFHKNRVYFYCENIDKSVYKIGVGANNGYSLPGAGNRKLLVMSSKLNSIDQVIEPEVRPIHPVFLPYWYASSDNVTINKDAKQLRKTILENMPERTEAEKRFKDHIMSLIQ